MSPGLARHLWHSPRMRSVIGAEIRRAALFLGIYVIGRVLVRHFRDRPFDRDFALDLLISSIAFVAIWTIWVIRAVRRTLRVEGELM